MSALTQTLLPDPVAPAMSRCGIRARSTAYALPDTSRPSANVSLLVACSILRVLVQAPEPDRPPRRGWGSRCPPRPCPGWAPRCGWSAPRAPSPGRPTRPSMRDSLTRTSGFTSYWVTTGPLLTPTTWAGIWKLRSFSSMMRVLAVWSTLPPLVGAAPRSRMSTFGSDQIRGRRGIGAASRRTRPGAGGVGSRRLHRRGRGAIDRCGARDRRIGPGAWRPHPVLRRPRPSGSAAPGWVSGAGSTGDGSAPAGPAGPTASARPAARRVRRCHGGATGPCLGGSAGAREPGSVDRRPRPWRWWRSPAPCRPSTPAGAAPAASGRTSAAGPR